MNSVNKVILVGNLGRDPEVRTMQNGKRVANMCVATSESWKDKSGEWQNKTEWNNVVVFNDGLIGVIEKYLRKGSKVYVEGSLATRKWEDNGTTKYMTEIVIKNFNGTITLLDSTKKESSGDAYEPDNKETETQSNVDDEIPF